MPLGRADTLWAAGIALALFGLYLSCLATTVTPEDSGLFLVTAHEAGVSHPPGYPLYTAVAAAFARLPFGSVAWRVHLWSALCAAGAAALHFACARRLGARRLAAATAAAVYGASASFWYHAVVAEVYALNALLWFALLLLCLGLERDLRPGRLDAAAFLYGLALSNHWPLVVMSSPGLAILLGGQLRAIARRAPRLLLGLGAGLLPYLWLPWRSRAADAVTMFGPVDSLGRFWWTVSRAGYRAVAAFEDPTWIDRYSLVDAFFGALPQELGWPGFLAFGAGALLLRLGASPRRFWALLISFLGSSVGFAVLAGGRFSHMTQETFLAVQGIPIGIAALCIALALDRLRGTALVIAAGAILLVPPLVTHRAQNDLRRDTFSFDYARLVLESLPSNATLLADGGVDTGPIAYAHRVEGVRPDVEVFSQRGALFPNRLFDPATASLQQAADALAALVAERGTVYATFLQNPLRSVFAEHFAVRDAGLFVRISARTPGGPALPVAAARELLDRQLEGRYGTQWDSHRKRILFAACATLIGARTEHPALAALDACKLVRAENLAYRGELAEARPLLVEILDRFPASYLGSEQWHVAYELYLRSAPLPREPTNEEISRLLPALARDPRCDNRVAQWFVDLVEQEPDLELPVGIIESRFARCRGLMRALNRAHEPSVP